MPKGKPIVRLRDLKVSARDQLMIDPRIIQIEEGHNPRDYKLPENRAHLDELKASIKQHGVIQPLWVRYAAEKRSAVLVDGECRLRATLELIDEGVDIKAVPTIQVSATNEADRLVLALTANTGKPLSKWESGQAFRKLHGFGWSAEQIAENTGFTIRFIREAMELADAPEAVKVMLSAHAVTPSLALETVRRDGSQSVATLQARINEHRASGNTGPVKKARQSPTAPLLTLVKALLADVEDHAWRDTEPWMEVSRRKMVALRRYTEPEL